MKKVLVAIVSVILVVVSYFLLGQTKPQFPNAKELPGVILFYGDGCPHCVNIDNFLKNNKVEEKFKFQRKEVFNNKTNAQELVDIAKKNGLDTETLGVPFLWDGTKTYIGEEPIVKFFSDLLKTT